jgi:hypothetical protein
MTRRARINYRRCEISAMKRPSASFGGAPTGRVAVLTTRAGPGPVRAAEDRPFPPCLLHLQDVQKRHDRIDGRDPHSLLTPSRSSAPADCRGGRDQGKEILSAGLLMSA